MGRGFGSAVDGGVCPPAGEIGHMRREIGGQKGIGAGRLTSGDPVGDTQGVSAGYREGLAGGNGALFFLFPNEDHPAVPASPGLSTEVLLPSPSVLQGGALNVSVRFTATTEESVLLSYSHANFLGYRVTSADGDLVMTSPSEVVGDPWQYLVRPNGWPLLVSTSVPTDSVSAAAPYRLVTWLCEDEALPPGEYILEAGLHERESQYPWGSATFTVLATAPFVPVVP